MSAGVLPFHLKDLIVFGAKTSMRVVALRSPRSSATEPESVAVRVR